MAIVGWKKYNLVDPNYYELYTHYIHVKFQFVIKNVRNIKILTKFPLKCVHCNGDYDERIKKLVSASNEYYYISDYLIGITGIILMILNIL